MTVNESWGKNHTFLPHTVPPLPSRQRAGAHNFFWTIAKHTQLTHIDKNRRLCPPKHAQHETALMASRVPTAYLGVENTNTPQNSKKTKNNTLLQKCRSHLLIATVM